MTLLTDVSIYMDIYIYIYIECIDCQNHPKIICSGD